MTTNDQMKQAIESAAQTLDFNFSNKMSVTFAMLEQLNKNPIIEKIRSIKEVFVSYSGGGDSGSFEDIEVEMKTGLKNYNDFFSAEDKDFIDNMFMNMSDAVYSAVDIDCHNNEGGNGEISFKIDRFSDEFIESAGGDLNDDNRGMNEAYSLEDNLIRLLPIVAEFSFTQNMEEEDSDTSEFDRSIGDFSRMLGSPNWPEIGLGGVASLGIDWGELTGGIDLGEKAARAFNFLEKMSNAIDHDLKQGVLNADTLIDESVKGSNELSALLQSEEFNSIELLEIKAEKMEGEEDVYLLIKIKEKNQDPVEIEMHFSQSYDLIEALNIETGDEVHAASIVLKLAVNDGVLNVHEASNEAKSTHTTAGDTHSDEMQQKIDTSSFTPDSAEFDFIRILNVNSHIKTSNEFNLIRDRFAKEITDYIHKNSPELLTPELPAHNAMQSMIKDRAESCANEYIASIVIVIEARLDTIRENFSQIIDNSSVLSPNFRHTGYRHLVDMIQSGFRPGRDLTLINDEKINSKVLFDTIIESGKSPYLVNAYEGAIATDIAESRIKSVGQKPRNRSGDDVSRSELI